MERRIFALITATLIATGIFTGILFVASYSSADDPYGTPTEITIAPGMRYTWTPHYPADLTVVTAIHLQKQGSLTGNDVSIAQMNSGVTLQVDAPSDAAAGTVYHVVLKATASDPYQEKFIHIIFSIVSNLTVSGSHPNVIVGGSFSMTPSATGMGMKSWSVTSGYSLPDGLSLDPVTGTVTGTVSSAGDHTVRLTCTTSYGETADLIVTFRAVHELDITNSPLNGIIIMPS